MGRDRAMRAGEGSPWLAPPWGLPLAGVRVVDLSRVLAGPLATQLLADLGADVIKVEAPGGSDDTHAWKPPERAGESVYYLGVNRNKRSLELDLHAPQDVQLLHGLLAQADVLVENFRLGFLEGLGLGFSHLSPRYPRLIYARILGFGSTGPYAHLPGYDLVAQAMSGFMHVTGEPHRPGQKVGVAITDVLSGLYLAAAVASCLYERERTGKGRYVEVSLLEAGLAGLANLAAYHLMAGLSPGRLGNHHPTICPYGSFRAQDGDLVLAVGNDRQFARLCTALGRPQLSQDPRFATNPDRVAHRPELHAILEEALSLRPVGEWVEELRRQGVPCGPVQDLPAAFSDPHVRARGMVQETVSPSFGSLATVACPIWLDGGHPPVRLPPPRVGEHTQALRRALAPPPEGLVPPPDGAPAPARGNGEGEESTWQPGTCW
jgi:crotonobetainyl-CoA:carnitine CoA-transferase CaiB-like acyl-CoA transferase